LVKALLFFVYLPAVNAIDTPAVTASKDVPAQRKGRILLMDDEDVVRNIAGVMLKSLGHEVEFAEHGDEAIAKYTESMKIGMQFDSVILDLTIRGGRGGEETMKKLLEIDPHVKAIVSSGYTDSSSMSEYRSIGFKACLSKPYDIESLDKTLNSLLA